MRRPSPGEVKRGWARSGRARPRSPGGSLGHHLGILCAIPKSFGHHCAIMGASVEIHLTIIGEPSGYHLAHHRGIIWASFGIIVAPFEHWLCIFLA